MNNNNLNLDLQEIILILIIFYALYLILCNNKLKKENFAQTDDNQKLANNIKILTNFVNEINENNRLDININEDIIFNNKTTIEKLNGYSHKTLIFKNSENILNKNTEYIPIGTIISFSGNINDIPKNWAICDGHYYMLSKYSLTNNNLLINKDADKEILKKYNYPNFHIGIPHLDFIPLNKKNIFFKTPNLIGRTVYGCDIDDSNLGMNNGEVSRLLSLDQLTNHKHKVFKKENAKTTKIMKLADSITSRVHNLEHRDGYRVQFASVQTEANNGVTFSNEYIDTNVLLPPRDIVDKKYTNMVQDDIEVKESEIFNFQKKINTLPKSIGLYWIIKI